MLVAVESRSVLLPTVLLRACAHPMLPRCGGEHSGGARQVRASGPKFGFQHDAGSYRPRPHLQLGRAATRSNTYLHHECVAPQPWPDRETTHNAVLRLGHNEDPADLIRSTSLLGWLWSGGRDSNPRLPSHRRVALPSLATPRPIWATTSTTRPKTSMTSRSCIRKCQGWLPTLTPQG